MPVLRSLTATAVTAAILLTCGCYQYSGGDKKEPLQLWAYVAVGGGLAGVLGVWTALTTKQDDADRRAIGVGLAVAGAVLAVLGVA